MDRDISIHPISRIGLDNPDKGVLINICCVYSGYHAVVSHVKMNHDTFATDNHRLELSIGSAQKTWSVFAEAFSSSARQILTCCNNELAPQLKRAEVYEMQDGSDHVQEGQDQEIYSLVLGEGHAGLNLNHNIVVLDPVESEESHDDGGKFPIFSN